MGLTISNQEYSVFGNKSVSFFDVAFDSSYPAGGESLTPADIGLLEISHMQIAGNSGYIFEYDYTNKKLQALYPRSAQVAVVTDELTIAASGAANITSGQSIDVAGTFRSAVDAAVAGEVGAGVDLSGVTSVKVMAIGI